MTNAIKAAVKKWNIFADWAADKRYYFGFSALGLFGAGTGLLYLLKPILENDLILASNFTLGVILIPGMLSLVGFIGMIRSESKYKRAMQCPHCEEYYFDDRSLCTECYEDLARSCPSCGSINKIESQKCFNCKEVLEVPEKLRVTHTNTLKN